jgi:predicted MFS family arabinose efflux permease
MQNIIDNFKVDADMIGNFVGIFYISYVAMHIPLGIMLDHYQPKKVIAASMLVTVAGFAPLVYSDNWTIITIGRFISGAGSACAALGAFKMFRLCFGEEKFPKMLGYMLSIGLLSAVFSTDPITYLISKLGWAETLNYMVTLGLILAVYSFLVIPNIPNTTEKIGVKTILNDVKFILKNKMLWTVGVMSGFMVGPLEGFADAWSNQYLKAIYNFDAGTASSVTQFIYLGMAAGSIVLGYIFEKFKSYYSILLISGITMATVFTMVLFSGTDLFFLKILFFIIGFFCAYQVTAIAKAVTFTTEKHSALTATVANMIMMSFGYVFHRSIGKVMNWSWDGTRDAKGRILYNAANYSHGLSIIVIGLLIGISICLLLIFLERRMYRQKSYIK